MAQCYQRNHDQTKSNYEQQHEIASSWLAQQASDVGIVLVRHFQMLSCNDGTLAAFSGRWPP